MSTEPVQIYIPLSVEDIKRVDPKVWANERFQGLAPAQCEGEKIWAKHIGKDFYRLQDDPVHPDYKYRDVVRCKGTRGGYNHPPLPLVVEKVTGFGRKK